MLAALGAGAGGGDAPWRIWGCSLEDIGKLTDASLSRACRYRPSCVQFCC